MKTMSNKNKELLYKVGLVLAEWRLEKNISQEKLAELSEIHRTYLSELESGKRNPTLSIINQVVSSLDKTMTELFEKVDNYDK